MRTTYWFGVEIDFMRHKRTRHLAAVSDQIPELFVSRNSDHASDMACFRRLTAMGVRDEFYAGREWTNGQGRAESQPIE